MLSSGVRWMIWKIMKAESCLLQTTLNVKVPQDLALTHEIIPKRETRFVSVHGNNCWMKTVLFYRSQVTYWSFLLCPLFLILNTCTDMAQVSSFLLQDRKRNTKRLFPPILGLTKLHKNAVSERSDTAAEFLPSSHGYNNFYKIKGVCYQRFLVNVSFKIIVLEIIF